VAGWDKTYGNTRGDALYDVSYANLMLYNAVLPSYNSPKEEKKKDKVINASDPKNRDLVHSIMFG
jgi:hypothetical protein